MLIILLYFVSIFASDYLISSMNYNLQFVNKSMHGSTHNTLLINKQLLISIRIILFFGSFEVLRAEVSLVNTSSKLYDIQLNCFSNYMIIQLNCFSNYMIIQLNCFSNSYRRE